MGLRCSLVALLPWQASCPCPLLPLTQRPFSRHPGRLPRPHRERRRVSCPPPLRPGSTTRRRQAPIGTPAHLDQRHRCPTFLGPLPLMATTWAPTGNLALCIHRVPSTSPPQTTMPPLTTRSPLLDPGTMFTATTAMEMEHQMRSGHRLVRDYRQVLLDTRNHGHGMRTPAAAASTQAHGHGMHTSAAASTQAHGHGMRTPAVAASTQAHGHGMRTPAAAASTQEHRHGMRRAHRPRATHLTPPWMHLRPSTNTLGCTESTAPNWPSTPLRWPGIRCRTFCVRLWTARFRARSVPWSSPWPR